jgi:hypothetical protein
MSCFPYGLHLQKYKKDFNNGKKSIFFFFLDICSYHQIKHTEFFEVDKIRREGTELWGRNGTVREKERVLNIILFFRKRFVK